MVYKSVRQYQYSANVFVWSMILMLILFLIGIIAAFFDQPGESSADSSHIPHKIIHEIVVKVSPVENAPGEYILEYDNGYLELLRADGTRQPMIITDESQVEKVIDELQSLRSGPDDNQRAGDDR